MAAPSLSPREPPAEARPLPRPIEQWAGPAALLGALASGALSTLSPRPFSGPCRPARDLASEGLLEFPEV